MQNGSASFRKGKTPADLYFPSVAQPTKSRVPSCGCYSSCRILLKLHGLHDLCSLALRPTHCSVESPGKRSWMPMELWEPYPNSTTILVQCWGSFSFCPTSIFWPSRLYVEHSAQPKTPAYLQRLWSLLEMERHRGVAKTGSSQEGRH